MKTPNRMLVGGAAAVIAAVLLVTGCATTVDVPAVTDIQIHDALAGSFKPRGQATMDRLVQDDAQRLCSYGPGAPPEKSALEALEKAQLATIQYPADGLLGDWRAGERVAQSGVGKQFSDNPANPSGGNCYACHQMTPQEISYGNIGPSLLGYGKLRGNTEAVQRYTYGKIYNAEAFNACSNMPRFGHSGILTPQQIKDLTALLLDPQSPVNK